MKNKNCYTLKGGQYPLQIVSFVCPETLLVTHYFATTLFLYWVAWYQQDLAHSRSINNLWCYFFVLNNQQDANHPSTWVWVIMVSHCVGTWSRPITSCYELANPVISCHMQHPARRSQSYVLLSSCSIWENLQTGKRDIDVVSLETVFLRSLVSCR